MPKRQAPATKEVYQLKITLRDVRPPIWRRVIASDATTLDQLHWIIQISMGWTNSHLHQFIIDEEYYSEPMLELDDWGPEVKNEKRVRLSALGLEPKKKFIYEYDFGDSWRHEILVEKVLAPEAGGVTHNAWRANGRVRRKTAVGCGATSVSSKSSTIRTTRSMKRRWSGPEVPLTLRRSASKKPTRPYEKSFAEGACPMSYFYTYLG